MKKIKLIFIGTGYDIFYQANVKIYDLNNNLLFSSKTFNGFIEFTARDDEFYRVVATLSNDVIDKIFYVSKYNKKYCFIFDRAIINNNINSETVIFLLTDNFYSGLPIMNGEMILWQR